MVDWLTPRFARGLSKFGVIATPLTKLLKEAFGWSEEADKAFQALKGALFAAPILQLTDFAKPFIVECDVLGSGFSAVLHHGVGPWPSTVGNPLPSVTPSWLHMSVSSSALYKRCDIGDPTFGSDNFEYNLKFLLDQRLSTIPQHHWISKLFGYDFTVEYRPGCLNTLADALSGRDVD